MDTLSSSDPNKERSMDEVEAATHLASLVGQVSGGSNEEKPKSSSKTPESNLPSLPSDASASEASESGDNSNAPNDTGKRDLNRFPEKVRIPVCCHCYEHSYFAYLLADTCVYFNHFTVDEDIGLGRIHRYLLLVSERQSIRNS